MREILVAFVTDFVFLLWLVFALAGVWFCFVIVCHGLMWVARAVLRRFTRSADGSSSRPGNSHPPFDWQREGVA